MGAPTLGSERVLKTYGVSGDLAMRSLYALMFVCATLVVAGCGGSSTAPSTTTPPTTTEPAEPMTEAATDEAAAPVADEPAGDAAPAGETN